MSKTPLREYLEGLKTTAEAWAGEHGLSAWSVRHWSRGDKVPGPRNRVALEIATHGAVTSDHWTAWEVEQRRAQLIGAAA